MPLTIVLETFMNGAAWEHHLKLVGMPCGSDSNLSLCAYCHLGYCSGMQERNGIFRLGTLEASRGSEQQQPPAAAPPQQPMQQPAQQNPPCKINSSTHNKEYKVGALALCMRDSSSWFSHAATYCFSAKGNTVQAQLTILAPGLCLLGFLCLQ